MQPDQPESLQSVKEEGGRAREKERRSEDEEHARSRAERAGARACEKGREVKRRNTRVQAHASTESMHSFFMATDKP
jgi:hypothetical protein